MGNYVSNDSALAKCITFYSYKGGSGRSTTLVNTAKHLIDELNISPNNPMLIVDADLESAGLTFFFNLENKFTSKFQQSINTASLIFQNGKYFKDNTADNAFGAAGTMMRYPVNDMLIDKMQTAARKSYDIAKLFSGVRINSNEKQILEAMTEASINVNASGSAENDRDHEIFMSYNIGALFFKLSLIQNDKSIPEEEKAALKEQTITNALPAQEFVDISAFFDAPAGSVKFLGADIKSTDIVPHGSDLPSNIKKLLFQCTIHGYSTVLFDSGAGTQSTPYSLHKVSDVLVYCMRASRQFARGTYNQLLNSNTDLKRLSEDQGKKGTDRKTVIILPTAVAAPNKFTSKLCDESFNSIKTLTSSFSDIVDPTFCTKESALPEVELFKWQEIILGTSLFGQCDLKFMPELASYTKESTMPDDAKKAYNTYKALAKRIVYNSEVQ